MSPHGTSYRNELTTGDVEKTKAPDATTIGWTMPTAAA
jgi:hypothetical protein